MSAKIDEALDHYTELMTDVTDRERRAFRDGYRCGAQDTTSLHSLVPSTVPVVVIHHDGGLIRILNMYYDSGGILRVVTTNQPQE